MKYITLGLVQQQRKRWWEEMMIWADIGVATVGVVAILYVGYLVIEWMMRTN